MSFRTRPISLQIFGIVFCFFILFSSGLEAKPKVLTLKSILSALQVAKPTENTAADIPSADPQEALISAIEVKGGSKSLTNLILNEIGLKEGDVVDPLKIQMDVRNVQSLGLFSEVHADMEGSKLVFYVTENPQITTVEFKGLTVFTPSFLLENFKTKIGDYFNIKTIQKDIDFIKALYQDKGYTEAKVINVQSPEKTGDPLVFEITEGIIENIIVTGNRLTKDYVILREMETKPGSLIHAPTLKEDLRRIYNLSYFTELKPNFLPGTTPNTQILEIDLTERPSNGTFTFGGGYSATGGLSMFTNLNWDNLFGMGQTIVFNSQFGRASTYQFKYYNPWMWDKRKSFSFRTWLTNGSVESINPLGGSLSYQNEKRGGVELGVGWPYSYELKTVHYVKYEKVKLLDSNKLYTVQSYRYVVSYDTRDVVFNPTEGNFSSLSIEKGFKIYADSLDFTRYDIDLRKYFKTFEQQTIATRLLLGYIRSPDISDTDLFNGEYYRVGGGNTVRGYDEFSPFASGNKQVVANVEYRFLFGDTFQVILFVDAGYASRFVNPDGSYRTVSPFDLSQYKIGKGIGTRITIPMLGQLRLDFGIDEVGNSRIHFSVGQTF